MPLSVTYATVNGELVEETRDGVTTTYVSDTLGSVIQTRNTAGAQTSSTTYWPFGEVRTSTGSNPSPWGFCGAWGYYKDSATTYWMAARKLNTGWSRWLAVSRLWPLTQAYAYAQNGPLQFVEPVPLQGVAPPISPPKPIIAPRPTPIPIRPGPGVGTGPVIIIIGGVIAVGDLIRWGCTGETGLFTGIGAALGDWLFPGEDELPPELPECPKPPKTKDQANRRRTELLQNHGKCRRVHQGPVRAAARCPGGLHQTDIYLCGRKRVAASVVCCPCFDLTGITYYCFASVHDAK